MKSMTVAVLASALAWGCGGTAAHAQFVPSKPIEMVVHGGPGAGNDVFGRALISAIEQEKLAPVRLSIANKPGGGSTTAMNYLQSKAGDSYTIAVFTSVWLSDHLVQEPSKVNIYKDLTPIVRMVSEPLLVGVSASSPFKSFKEFVDEAKAKPKTMKQAGGSITSRDNIIRQLIMKQTGADWAFISFPSGGERLAALLGGHVELLMLDPSEAISQVRAGKIRPVAQVAEQRLAAFPDVPTIPEAGYNITKFPQIRGVVGPPNMPADALAYYEDLFQKVGKSAAWKKYVDDNYLESDVQTSAATKAFLPGYETLIRDLLRETGAKIVR
jgi:putative tricarboxylic transport membrane protein